MSKDKRLYARIDIGFDEHDKIFPLTDQAFRALIEMTLYSRRQLTDGFLGERLALKKWGSDVIQELCENDVDKPSLIRVNDGWQIHDFAEHQTTKSDIEAKREAGRKGGLAKAKAKQKASESVAGAKRVLEQNGSTTLAKTETETETYSSKELYTSSFDDAWSAWPKKTEKKKSFEQFQKACKKMSISDLVAAIKQFGEAYSMNVDKQFVPALAVWLRNERWTDELPSRGNATQSAMQKNLDRFYQEFGGESYDSRGGLQAIDAGFSA